MQKLSTILATTALLGLATGPAFAAGVNKTWVSSTTGNDTGTCQFTLPCKTFAYAITQTAPGGELYVKDGGSYGPVTITQTISIVSEGAVAAISVPSGGVGVTVNAGVSDKVVLQGLMIDGHNLGGDGIDFNSGLSLLVDNCRIRNLGYGIYAKTQTGPAYFNVTNTIVSDVTGSAINIQPSAPFSAILSRVGVHSSNVGIFVLHSNVEVVESVVGGNNTGIDVGDGGNVLLGQRTVSGNNNYGILNQSGIFDSYGDNYINANGTDISGTTGGVQKR